MICHPTDKRARGFSVVEMMVAMTISLVLIAGVIQIFVGSKQSYRVTEALSRIQENGRFAVEFLGRDAREIGFFGCADPRTIQFHDNVDITKNSYDGVADDYIDFDGSGSLDAFNNVTADSDTSVLGKAVSDYGLTVGTGEGEVFTGTDIIAIKRSGTCDGGNVVFTGLGNTYRYSDTANVKIEDATSCGIDQDSIVMITNCASADYFGVTNNPQSGGSKDTLAHGSSLNAEPKLQGEYGPGSEVFNLKSVVLYIGNGPAGEPSLYRKRLTAGSTSVVTEELVSGVEDMQITFGEDTDGDLTPNYYVVGGSVSDIEEVVALRVELLVRSAEDNITQEAQTYTYNGSSFTAGDNRLRKVFTSTIALRNRLK